MSGDHDGDHHPEPEPYAALRARALESLLVEKGLVTTDAVDEIVRTYEQDIGPLNGARVVARAWVDRDYKRRLLENGTEAIAELGIGGAEGAEIVVLESTPDVHNVVVCTLCSCYPWPVLGLPPTWYKDPAYRSRAVLEPRAVLREFGLEVDESKEVRVWDSTAAIRYMVLPERPDGTDGLPEEKLAELVTRDSMIGVASRGPHPPSSRRPVRETTMSRQPAPVISDMTGDEALPRRNGELVFEEPWEGRAFGLAVAMNERGVYDWADFRDRLVAETAADERHGEPTGYYQRWLRALERLSLDRGLVTSAELEARTAACAEAEPGDE